MAKGLLVIGMLLIHASNLFIGSPQAHWLVYPVTLGFVSGSWLCISGYIIGRRYRPRFLADAGAISRRLLGRGWRLVAIFVASNIVLGRLSPLACIDTGASGYCDLQQIFIVGNDSLAFEVLLGIGYLLLLAPLCLTVANPVVALVAIGAMAGLSLGEGLGYEAPMLAWMLTCGIAGVAIGSYIGADAIASVMNDAGRRLAVGLIAAVVFVGTKAAVLAGLLSSISPIAYVPHVISALCLLYLAGARLARIDWIKRPMSVMAHYSLLAYMGQMAILLAWYRLAGTVPVANSFAFSVLVALVVLLASLYALSALRTRFRAVDRLYLEVFG